MKDIDEDFGELLNNLDTLEMFWGMSRLLLKLSMVSLS